MLMTVPQDFRSTPELNKQYAAIRNQIYPLLRSKANISGLAGFIDSDDLLQELEVKALYGLSTYNPEKGSLHSLIWKLAANTVANFLDYAATQARSPRVAVEWQGGWVEVPGHALSLDSISDANLAEYFTASAEDYYLNRQEGLQAGMVRARFRALVDRRVDGFTRDLFWARINPPIELLIFARNRTGKLPESPDQLHLATVAAFYEILPAVAREAWADLGTVVKSVVESFDDDDRGYLEGGSCGC